LTLFAISKDEWDTKEDAGKPIKHALYLPWHAKGTSGLNKCQTAKKKQQTNKKKNNKKHHPVVKLQKVLVSQ